MEGALVFNATYLMLNAALAGFELAYVFEDMVQAHLAEGRLVRVLEDWCPPFSGYFLNTQVSGSRRRPSRCWLMRSATGTEAANEPQQRPLCCDHA